MNKWSQTYLGQQDVTVDVDVELDCQPGNVTSITINEGVSIYCAEGYWLTGIPIHGKGTIRPLNNNTSTVENPRTISRAEFWRRLGKDARTRILTAAKTNVDIESFVISVNWEEARLELDSVEFTNAMNDLLTASLITQDELNVIMA